MLIDKNLNGMAVMSVFLVSLSLFFQTNTYEYI